MSDPERDHRAAQRSRRRPALRRGAGGRATGKEPRHEHASDARWPTACAWSPTTCRTWRRSRSACGWPPARATSRRTSTASRICWSTWPSRAPSGAAPPTSPRRSRRSAASSMPPPAWRPPPTSRACSRPTSASRSISWPTSCRSRATPQDELEREREVILQEIAATRDSPDEIAYELLQDAAFPDQAIGRPILGTTKSVEQLRRRRPAHVPRRPTTAPARMVLSAAGNVDHAELVRHAEAQFGRPQWRRRRAIRAGALCRWHAHLGQAVRAEPSRHGVCRAVVSRARSSTPPRCSRGCSAGACRRGCSRRCGSGAASAMRSIRAAGRWPIRGCSASMRRRGRR